jgi:hypothetical protein
MALVASPTNLATVDTDHHGEPEKTAKIEMTLAMARRSIVRTGWRCL